MKNFAKKLFSLLLVGVVTVSMFSFVAPPPVEAVEETPSRGTVIFKFVNLLDAERSAEGIVDFYGDDDYYSSQPISLHCRGYGIFSERKTVCYNIPAEAKIVVLRDGCRRWIVWGNFKLDESSEFSSGCIRAVVECSGVRHFERRSKRIESSGCWKQIQV